LSIPLNTSKILKYQQAAAAAEAEGEAEAAEAEAEAEALPLGPLTPQPMPKKMPQSPLPPKAPKARRRG